MTASFLQHAEKGRALDAFREAIVFGALFAIGSAWSTAIREITVFLVPDDTSVLAELGAALITTVLGVAASVLVAQRCCDRSPPPPLPSATSSTARGPKPAIPGRGVLYSRRRL